MSLILEALRKLERDKQTPERSLVVTGASDWARSEPRAGRALLWGLGALAVAGVAFLLWPGGTAHAPVPPKRPPAAAISGAAPGGDLPTARTASAPPRRAAPRSSAADAALPDLSGARPAARSTPTPASAAPATAAPTTGTADAAPPETAEAPPESGPPSATEPRPARAEIELQAITQRDGRPIAIVNGRLVREGDSFDGIRVLRIGAAEIEVEVKGQRRTIGF